MLSHERIWAAIDRLAQANDLTPSGLAKRAGLDSTAFNKSKRFARDGRARWPSTESLSKIMDATGVSFAEFTTFVDTTPAQSHPLGFSEPDGPASYLAPNAGIPLLGLAQAGAGGYFDDAGFPVGEGWEKIQFPGQEMADGNYALEITGDSMLPLYREGDIIIVSPGASVRSGDRIAVKTSGGEVMAKILKRKTAKKIELSSANENHPDRTFELSEIEWLARIIWASQ